MEKESFEERVNNQNKVALCDDFKQKILFTAMDNGLRTNAVYQLWVKYTEDCKNFDQSPIYSEFKEWNKLK